MKKLIWDILKLSPVIAAATVFTANSAFAEEVNQQVTPVAELSEEAGSMAQVTSVSQFSDVQPTDWAFQALQSLVERYGCIAGYPNGTYRGNRALTRYEFAAGLNACLDRVNELIATATANIVSREDLATLGRLQEEFSAELATLRGRVDALEARTAEIEANQFSTTTKLKGEVIFAFSDAFGEAIDGTDLESSADNTTFTDRVRLNFDSSFTGKDKLRVRLQARNVTRYDDVTGTDMARLAFDGNNNNDFGIGELWYEFQLSDALR
ncbi:MAG: iron uptake porin, partial [Rivularia sp. (in: cyanobacteria)]